ncbi:zf-TFIIB domain-containing protein [Hyphomicrobiaceae bacterium 22]|uniref:Zf-TFIIB domain-containing protein n=2 Tax=Prosthecodimorpha staleyi TaxID=2840188 RepID=A0A947D7N3_9HYPH|nr:zf-TFIIB domain-containing protein [Prosthecodimorpha staleyi]
MKCPLDGEALVMTERQGIEIDYCPKCRGVWLDRGELDKIIERASPPAAQPPTPAYQGDPRAGQAGGLFGSQPLPPRAEPSGWGRRDDDDDDRHERRHGGYGHQAQHQGQPYPHRRKSMLGELFDFD